MIRRVVSVLSSLRLTVVCLAFGMVLVFAGTIAQVHVGTYKAQNEFFRSFFVYWSVPGTGARIPVLPGGYLLGGVLLLNLITAHVKRFSFTKKKAGIWLVHVGLILLLLGQLLTDMLSRESLMHIREGGSKNYSEIDRESELAIVDVSDPSTDLVLAIPQGKLRQKGEIRHSALPFAVRVNDYFPNSLVAKRADDDPSPPAATQGFGVRATVRGLAHETANERRDVPSATIELVSDKGSMGSWLVSEHLESPQPVIFDNRQYEIELRPRREYKPFNISLLEFQHDLYAGTDIPKNFASRVRLERPESGEKREVLIYMNSPLRYGGETFYQASFDKDDKGTVLQVVHNPGWLTPYLACILVATGLIVQFMSHLVPFLRRRTPA